MPKRPGSGTQKTGLSKQSLDPPGACSVDEPSKRPHRRVFDLATEIVDNLCLASQALGGLIAVEPDVLQLALGHKIDSPYVNHDNELTVMLGRLHGTSQASIVKFLQNFLPTAPRIPDSDASYAGRNARQKKRFLGTCSNNYKNTRKSSTEAKESTPTSGVKSARRSQR